MKTYPLSSFELAQLTAFDHDVDQLYAPQDAARLHQLIQAALQSAALTEADCHELRLILPRILQQQEEEAEPKSQPASRHPDDWPEWSEQASLSHRQQRARLARLHELLHMLQILQFQQEKSHHHGLFLQKGHRRDR